MTIDIDEAKVRRNEFGLWLGWTFATTGGLLLGMVPLALVLPELDLGLARVIVPLLAGFFVGLLQWLVLRGYLTNASDWILNGAAGWATGYAVGLLILQNLTGSVLGVILGFLLFGAAIGLIQWPVLRREIPNALPWILANVIGWALGLGLNQIILNAIFGTEPSNPAAVSAVSAILIGLVAGAITGLAFVWIVRQPEISTTIDEGR
jgi:hypothetical protein